jgi:II/X family phage/plasmid replication protein
LTQRIDRDTGCIEFEYTNFQVNHSWNYRVLWKIDDKHIVYDPVYKKSVETVGIPYLRMEFSAPKVLYGNNLVSIGIEGLFDACAVVRVAFEKYSGVVLQGPGDWHPYRVDTCANYILASADEVKGYIRYLQRLDYPRRIGNCYKDTGLYFASVHNTLKVYFKGDEFKKHDACRFVDEIEKLKLQKFADKILRVEVENKRRLKYLVEKYEEKYNEKLSKFKGWVSLEDLLSIVNLQELTGVAMNKLLNGKETKVMRALDVFRLLSSVLGVRAARAYYGIYMLLVTQGQMEVKRQVARRTYYRALKVFRENDISIFVSDFEKNENFQECTELQYFLGRGFPSDFSLEMVKENKYYQMPLAA